MSKYKISFSPTGTLLFISIMIPNFFWSIYPAKNDILSTPSITLKLDLLTSIFQFILVAAVCMVKNTEKSTSNFFKRRLNLVLFISIIWYYGAWIAYYIGSTHFFVIFLLSTTPTLIFGSFILKNKLFIALLPLIFFSVGHIIFAFANFYHM